MNEPQFYPQINNPNYNQNQSVYPPVQGTFPNQNRNTQYPLIVQQERMQGGNDVNRAMLVNNINLNSGSSRQNQLSRQVNQNSNRNAILSRDIQIQPTSIQNNHPPRNQQQSSNLGQNQMSMRNELVKMDGIFAESFKSLKCDNILHGIMVFILLWAVLLLYKFKIFKGAGGQQYGVWIEDGQSKESIIPIIIVAESIIFVVKLLIHFNTYARLNFAIQTANQIGHGVTNQPANLSQSFQSNTSERYLLASTEITYDQGLQRRIKNTHLEVTMNQIRLCAKIQTCCLHQLHQLIEFGMFICGIFIIVSLAQDRTTWIEKTILIATVVYWFLQNYRTIIYTILLLLCPIFTVGIIVFVCVTFRRERRQLRIPEVVHPTNEQIVNCGGSCAICMSQFNTSNDVIILPCSDKHMFHQLCIKGWLNVKSTCPNCRYDLTTNSRVEPHNQN